MEKILVPTDFTPIAETGLRLAVEIARRSGAVVSLMNFTRHPFGSTFSATGDISKKRDGEDTRFTLELLKVNQAKLEDLAAAYRSDGVEIEYGIIDDELKDGIDNYLNNEMIDLVVMGTSGEATVEEAFTGNHTEQVIEVSSCPVLSVRDGFRIEDFSRMVLAVNEIREDQILIGLNTLRQLAECFDAHIDLLHVVKGGEERTDLETYFTRMADTAALQNYTVTIIEASEPAEAVIQFARDHQAGVVAVIKNSKDGIFRIFSNHFSNRLVKEVGRPVFTFNLQNA